MPRFRKKRKSKFVTRRALPFLLAKNAEAKYIDSAEGGTDILLTDNAPHDDQMTLIQSGSRVDRRAGNEIQVTGFYMTFTCSPHILGVPEATSKVRYIRIVLYTKRSVAEPDLEVGPVDIIEKEPYIVWIDKMVQVPFNSSASKGHVVLRKKWKPYMKATYTDTSIGDIAHNGVYLTISTDTPNPELVEFSYNARLFFRDL